MYKVVIYRDRSGKDEITEYLRELAAKPGNKEARIKLQKTAEYIRRLETYGVSAGKPTIDHIRGTDLWELRPIDDRIFFAYWKDNKFVLLHMFTKKTQKTPPREIKAAQRKLRDFLERSNFNEYDD